MYEGEQIASHWDRTSEAHSFLNWVCKETAFSTTEQPPLCKQTFNKVCDTTNTPRWQSGFQNFSWHSCIYYIQKLLNCTQINKGRTVGHMNQRCFILCNQKLLLQSKELFERPQKHKVNLLLCTVKKWKKWKKWLNGIVIICYLKTSWTTLNARRRWV